MLSGRASCVFRSECDAGRVNIPAMFADPKPVAFSLHSDLRRDDVLDRLGRAVGDYYKTEGGAPRFLGLEGSVTDGYLSLVVRPYLSPGERQLRGMMPLVVHGKVVTTGDGTEVKGTATAPVGRLLPVLLAISLVGCTLLGISSGPFIGIFAVGAGVLIGAVWTWLIRHNQRAALGRTDEIARMLGSIVSEN